MGSSVAGVIKGEEPGEMKAEGEQHIVGHSEKSEGETEAKASQQS